MERKGFIGGSDVGRILKGDWNSLWREKTGRAEPEDLSNNLAVQMGVFTEKFNIGWFLKQTDYTLVSTGSVHTETIDTVPARGTVDALVMQMNSSEPTLLECKHTNAFNNMETCLQTYMPQVQTYLRLTGLKQAQLSVFFGNGKWETAHINFNQDYINKVWPIVVDFWNHVVHDTEPVDENEFIINTNTIEVNDMIRRDASKDNEFVSLAHEYLDNEEAAAVFNRAKTAIKKTVKDNEREVWADGLLSIKRGSNRALRFTNLKKDA